MPLYGFLEFICISSAVFNGLIVLPTFPSSLYENSVSSPSLLILSQNICFVYTCTTTPPLSMSYESHVSNMYEKTVNLFPAQPSKKDNSLFRVLQICNPKKKTRKKKQNTSLFISSLASSHMCEARKAPTVLSSLFAYSIFFLSNMIFFSLGSSLLHLP